MLIAKRRYYAVGVERFDRKSKVVRDGHIIFTIRLSPIGGYQTCLIYFDICAHILCCVLATQWICS